MTIFKFENSLTTISSLLRVIEFANDHVTFMNRDFRLKTVT